MSSKVSIVTDSTNCLPPEILEQYGIRVLPVGLVIEGKLYLDCVNITLEEVCSRLDSLEKQPTTAAVSPGDFFNVFTELADSTDNIVCILVSKALTATQESAYQARRLVRSHHPNLNIEIIDSKTSAGALGFIVAEVARAAEEGKGIREVVGVARDMISRVVYLAALDTLKYLINIGRAPRVTNIGELLKVKPIIGFVDDTGLLEVVARVRGRNKSLAKLVDLVENYIDTELPTHVMVHYADGLETAEELKGMLESRYRCSEILLTPYSPVMIAATGPMVGISFYS
ncbi:MAG: DegV family protein [Dehalococcoidales bacterium]|nr:MAG: DegV family protein [Dehalococcoidales bacterium]